MDKPRNYWVADDKKNWNLNAYTSERKAQLNANEGEQIVHVIEHSAYMTAVEALKYVKFCLDHDGVFLDSRKLNETLQKLGVKI